MNGYELCQKMRNEFGWLVTDHEERLISQWLSQNTNSRTHVFTGRSGETVTIKGEMFYQDNGRGYDYFFNKAGLVFVWDHNKSKLSIHKIQTWLVNNSHRAQREFIRRFGHQELVVG